MEGKRGAKLLGYQQLTADRKGGYCKRKLFTLPAPSLHFLFPSRVLLQSFRQDVHGLFQVIGIEHVSQTGFVLAPFHVRGVEPLPGVIITVSPSMSKSSSSHLANFSVSSMGIFTIT